MNTTEAIAKRYGISEESLYRKTKKRRFSEPRMLAIAMLVATGDLKQKDMVLKFNLKPSTISHAVCSVRWLVRYNHDFRGKVHEVIVLIHDTKEHRERLMEQLLNVNIR